jgi:DNA-binding MarR family transcriptional regulator
MTEFKTAESNILELVDLFWKIFQKIRSQHSQIGTFKPQSWFYLLRTVNAFAQLKGYTVTELSRNANINPQTMSEALKRLEKEGIIKRERSSQDQRIVMVYLTDKGKEIRKKVMDIRYHEIKRILKKLEKDEREELVRTVKRASELLKKVV